MSVDTERSSSAEGAAKASHASQATQRVKAECLAACAVLALSVLLPLPDTTGRILHIPSICPFYQLTGLPCPGCGLTRAFVLLSHGDWRQSLAFHPMGWAAYAAFILVAIDGAPAALQIRDRGWLPRRVRSGVLWACVCATLAAGLIRLIGDAAEGRRLF
ncbi:hypothetical protein CCAX7_50130 [Capsulimonas corticalis]|uniref:Uncharacterized protein n=1 Tax=Capsulimonas corticalis TaxID=2219043 RepID=A0A402CPG5_9BACT|nr:DUF2752 domain-containing protein [Capsulimonas corticalis]BDI32962.1 hypothetical protein CCAX7_50130 [Capsulimonas corticalis]